MDPNTLHSNLQEIQGWSQAVKTLDNDSVKICEELTTLKLYENTVLDSHRRFQGTNEVLRKNIYYLATKTPNVSADMIDELLRAQVIDEHEKNEIVNINTDRFRGIKMYVILVGKEDPDGRVRAALRQALFNHNNFDAVSIIETLLPQAGALDPGWECEKCTFLNPHASNICEMCMKTKDFELNDGVEVKFCPQCTYINTPEKINCEICNFKLEPEPVEGQQAVQVVAPNAPEERASNVEPPGAVREEIVNVHEDHQESSEDEGDQDDDEDLEMFGGVDGDDEDDDVENDDEIGVANLIQFDDDEDDVEIVRNSEDSSYSDSDVEEEDVDEHLDPDSD